MSTPKRTVLITGCSDGGLGAALAIALHDAGLHVYATARNVSKMTVLKARGIETLQLDVQSESSIAAAVSKLSSLDILINNAGAVFTSAVTDIDIAEAKKLFDLNVWSQIAVTQAFVPLILKSKLGGMVVNQTSVSANVTLPFQAVYNASKAAFAMISDTLRLELEPFGIKVVDLRTAMVKSNIMQNRQESQGTHLPKGSIFEPAREVVEKVLGQEGFQAGGVPTDQWAKGVVYNLLKKNPPPVIWSGESATLVRVSTVLPFGWFDNMIKKMTKMDVIGQIIAQAPKSG